MKKTLSPQKPLTRKGAASFYAVIFASLVFTVLVLSFIRLMISETNQNIATDLSQSAYDSAVAGVEDAKAAIVKCSNNSSAPNCNNLYGDNCYNVSKILYGTTDGNKEQAVGSDANQAYTCVKISQNPDDYRIQINSERPVAVIPINAQVGKIQVSWYSQQNNTNNISDIANKHNDQLLYPKDKTTTPPVAFTGIIENGSSDINAFVFKPFALDNNNSHSISEDAYNTLRSKGGTNEVTKIKCNFNNEFACAVNIKFDKSKRINVDYVIFTLPYGETADLRVKKYDLNDNRITFSEQVSVDSTGRANDYYRRVESRLNLRNVDFPYPIGALISTTNISKNFKVTNNCWNVNNGRVSSCDNSGTI